MYWTKTPSAQSSPVRPRYLLQAGQLGKWDPLVCHMVGLQGCAQRDKIYGKYGGPEWWPRAWNQALA